MQTDWQNVPRLSTHPSKRESSSNMRYLEPLNMDNPMNNPAKRVGLGDAVQTVIHAGLNIIPMPAQTRAAIKGCSGCRRRKDKLNGLVPNIKFF